MPNSMAQQTDLTCPNCQQTYTADIWLIIDTGERPDLLTRLQAGTVHDLSCPHCHTGVQIDAPLLIYRPHAQPAILFSPAQQTTGQQDQEQAIGLINALRQQLGPQWQDAWLADGLPGVQRAMLPAALSNDQATPPRRVSTSGAIPAQLGAILTQLQQPPRSILDMPQRVTLCRQALALISKTENEQFWATLQIKLGNSLVQTPQGDRAENIEQAIAAYQDALQVMSRATMPVEWAGTMNNLAIAYRNRIRGDRAENIERAIAAYQDALQVTTRAAMPVDWAQIMNNLANAYLDRIHGDRADNIEQAIAACQDALQVRTRAAMPVEWATTMMNLANAYRDRIRGDRADNIEQAIAAHQEALQVRSRAAMPVEWAEAMNNLAIAYRDRIRGDRADNIEQAIAAYQKSQIADALGEEWPDFQLELWQILDKLDKASDDEIDELVTDLFYLGLQTPAASIFRRILKQHDQGDVLQEVSRSKGDKTVPLDILPSSMTSSQFHHGLGHLVAIHRNKEKYQIQIKAFYGSNIGDYGQVEIHFVETAGRYLNAGFFTSSREYVAMDRPLALDQGPYRLAVNIGVFWGPGTAVSPFPPLPDDLYDENDTLTLDVIARTQDTGLQINSPQQTLTLPRAGDSPAVLFDLAIGQPGRFTIDVDVFYHGHLLQSRRTEFKVVQFAGEELPPSAWPVQDGYITFTRTAHLTREALAPLVAAPRRLTILAERDASWQNIGLRIYNNSGESLALRPSTHTDASLTPLLNGLRRRLLSTMDAYSGFIGGSEPLLANHLGQLAEAGYAFYRSLLPDLPDASSPAAGSARSQTALRPGDIIQIAPLSAQVSVPWELVYERPIHTQYITLCSTFRTHGPAATDCPHHNDPYVVCPHAFWGYRYIIEQLPCRVERHAPLPGQSLPLFVRNGRPLHLTAVTYDTGQQFSNHWQNLRRLAEEPQLHLEQITSWAEADTFFTHRETAVNLLYFYTHGGKNDLGQPYLQISDGSKITLNDLEAWQATWRQDAPLVVLNACESADYTPDDFESLILFFSQRGAAGVIGTQCPVKELLADAFILPFFAHFLRQMPAGEALFAARRQLLYDHLDPRGLVYSLFAAAEVKLAQPVLEPER